jgi:predicted nucleic acid-binding protein
MTPAGTLDCVVGASVGIKLFIVEPLSDEAHALFAGLAADPPARFYAPDLFYIECTNILLKYVKRLGLAPEDAGLFVGQLGQLALTAISTESLRVDAFEIAAAHDLTAYDAAYVALARQLALPLITADGRLARRLAGTALDIRWLGDLTDETSTGPVV